MKKKAINLLKIFMVCMLVVVATAFVSADFNPREDITGKGVFYIKDFVGVNGTYLNFTGLSIDQICIDGVCHSFIPLNETSGQYIDIATGQLMSASNTTTWDMAKSINETANIQSLGFFISSQLNSTYGLNDTFEQYLDLIRAQQMSESNTTTWDMTMSLNSTQNLFSLGGGLNSTFLQYDDYNKNWTTLSYNLFGLNNTFLQYVSQSEANRTYALNDTLQHINWNWLENYPVACPS